MNHDDNMVLRAQAVRKRFGQTQVHRGISFDVKHGEIFALAGSSGSGKSLFLREALLLERADSGSIRLLGEEIVGRDEDDILPLRRRIGVLFQRNALFNSLSLAENISVPMFEHTDVDTHLAADLAALKIAMVGLPPEAAVLLPSQLSGGMQKRAALSRALALDPEVLFLDEPTTGLDPHSAEGLDDLILGLRNALDLTIIVVTHDLDSLWRVADRVAVLGDGVVVGVGSMKELSKHENPHIRSYFEGDRGRAAMR